MLIIKYKNKTIFIFLLILTINFIIISSYNEEYPFYEKEQKEKLDLACKKYSIFCSMGLAIEDIFSEIQNEDISVGDIYVGFAYTEYINVHMIDMTCEDLVIENPKNSSSENELDNSYQIIFNNCNVLLKGTIILVNDFYSKKFGDFLTELKYNSINFYQRKEIKGDFKVFLNKSTPVFKYNIDSPFFSSEIKDKEMDMNFTMEYIEEKFEILINQKIDCDRNINEFISTTKNINKFFSFYSNNSIFDDNKQVTYILYKRLYNDIYVDIKNKVFVNEMKVIFEYTLNNDITYNRGYFIINNFIFNKKPSSKNNYENYNISEKSAPFDILLEYRNDIWKTIIDDFKKCLEEYKGRN